MVSWASVMQQKTNFPVRFELTEPTRESIRAWIEFRGLSTGDYLFPSRLHHSPHIAAASTHELLTRGSPSSAWNPTSTRPTRYAERKRRSSTGERRTSGPSSCCSVIPNLRTPYDTWVSKLTMLWKWLSKRKSDPITCCRNRTRWWSNNPLTNNTLRR